MQEGNTLSLFFMIFEGKRKQRKVPIVLPLKNTTVDFTKMIGKLYLQHKDHKNIAEKKITYFLDYVRQHFYLKTTHLNKELAQKLATKSGKNLQEVETLFRFIQKIQNQNQITERELQQLCERIEVFKLATQV